ncbi:hypothetical protein KI387_000484, partial [Taxus chinensis]
ATVASKPEDAREIVAELEKRNVVLWQFAASVHKICRMKDSGPAYISPLDLDTLASPIGSAPSIISHLMVKGKPAYDFHLKAAKAGEVRHRFSKRLRKAEVAKDTAARGLEQVEAGAQ